jgi:hypothetical protein
LFLLLVDLYIYRQKMNLFIDSHLFPMETLVYKK